METNPLVCVFYIPILLGIPVLIWYVVNHAASKKKSLATKIVQTMFWSILAVLALTFNFAPLLGM